jgi:hypothetical protein
MAVNWALGANALMSDAWPNRVYTALLGDLQWRRGIGMLDDDIGALVDERLGGVAFLAGSYQLFTHTTLTWASGLTLRMAMVKALMPRTTSGIGKEPM